MSVLRAAKNAVWGSAVLLILVQMIGGMRDMPQFPFFLIYLQERLQLESTTISGIVSSGQIAGTIAALIGGALAARIGSKWVLVGGLLLSSLSSLVFQLQWPGFVVLIWMIGSIGASLITVSGASYLTQLSHRGGLGILSALYALSITVGGAIGNPIAGAIIEQRGYSTWGWYANALMLVAFVLVFLFMPQLHKPSTNDGNNNSGNGDKVPKPNGLMGLLPATRNRNVRLLIGLRCLPTIFYSVMMVLIPLLLNQLSNSKTLVAAYGTTTLVVASAAQLLVGRVADRWGARRPTLIAYSVMLLAGLSLAATANTVWGLFGFGVMGIAAAWSLSTLMYVWVADGVAQPDHASTFGLLHAVWSLSMISGSLLGGWLVRLTPGLPFLIGGLINIGALALAMVYYKRVNE